MSNKNINNNGKKRQNVLFGKNKSLNHKYDFLNILLFLMKFFLKI